MYDGTCQAIKETIMKTYIPQLYPRKDRQGNVRQVEVTFDSATKTYVGSIRGGAAKRMLSGAYRQPVIGLGECASPSGAADQAILNYEARK
jgi:hypothetical protein